MPTSRLSFKGKNLFFVLFLILASVLVPAQSAEAASKTVHVGVLAASKVNKEEAKLHVQTNLPYKMKFFVVVSDANQFEKEVKVKVAKNGKLKKTVDELPNGTYKVTYQSYQPKKQPRSVKKIIGKKGQHLKGEDVTKKKVVKFSETIKVEHSTVKSKAEKEALAKQEEAKQQEREAALAKQEEVKRQEEARKKQEIRKQDEAREREKQAAAKERQSQNGGQSGSQNGQAAGDKNEQQVLVTATGSKYHNHKCGNGTYYPATLSEAKARGLTPCSKCYG
ncbi:hypothetical protein [Listeria kieliensis]|uniref:hypothetical protein n=1 Tax=Listeria kieliensis TaxID=1621700 RepID=UPI000E20DE2A|nr:hypothetical protein [Listeria kieliensis]